MIVNPKQIDDFKSSKFRLEGLRIQLYAQDDSEEPRFSGIGTIAHDENGQLVVTVYDQGVQAGLGHLANLPDIEAGEEIPSVDKLSMIAADLSGNVWKSSNLFPGTTSSLIDPGAVVTADLYELRLAETKDDADQTENHKFYLWMFFPGEYDIPLNAGTKTTISNPTTRDRISFKRDTWAFGGEPINIRLQKSDLGLELFLESDEKFNSEYIENRVAETLSFLTGRPATWTISRINNSSTTAFKFVSADKHGKSGGLLPPIRANGVESPKHWANLFLAYLKFVQQNREQSFHPVSRRVLEAQRASQGTLTDKARQLAIAAEGIAHYLFQELGESSESEKRAIKEMKSHVDGWTGDQAIKERTIGSLNIMLEPNSRTALNRLVETGVVTKQMHSAWNSTRHSGAHGKDYSQTSQKLFDQAARVQVMIALLVAKGIGYEGLIIDYGSRGWPDIDVPLTE